MKFRRFQALFIGIVAPYALYGADPCQQWFSNAGVSRGADCLSKCTTTSVGMGTFDCPSRCPEFCSESYTTKITFKLTDLYPGLTAAEKAFAAKHPSIALKAYTLTWKAERECRILYVSSQTNDESDACRHFIWAALLRREIGPDMALEVLNAHENDPKQPNAEKSMDLANNRAGLLSSEKLSRTGIVDDQTILSEFKASLSKGELIVLRPSQKVNKK